MTRAMDGKDDISINMPRAPMRVSQESSRVHASKVGYLVEGLPALRCMACQEWQAQHVCPICKKTDRNTGGVDNAWAYFDGCLTHSSTAPRCIGHLLSEDPLQGRGNSMIPTVLELLGELFPNKGMRDYLPLMTIMYMGPGGHRQWPMSISALLDRLSWLVLETRSLALTSFQSAVQKNLEWSPKCYKGSRIARVPPPPIKFLDIGTKMGCYEIRDHIPGAMTRRTSSIQDSREMGFHLPAPFIL